MSDKALENAKALKIKALAEVERLESEARVWRDRIAMADQFIDQWDTFASDDVVNLVEGVSSERNKQEPPVSDSRKRTVGNSPKEEVAAAAREFILDRGMPISRDDLYDLLTAHGFIINGKDPKMVLSTMLWRMREQIARVKGGGYWPADIPNDDADYDPMADIKAEERVEEELRAIGDDAEAEGLL